MHFWYTKYEYGDSVIYRPIAGEQYPQLFKVMSYRRSFLRTTNDDEEPNS